MNKRKNQRINKNEENKRKEMKLLTNVNIHLDLPFASRFCVFSFSLTHCCCFVREQQNRCVKHAARMAK